MRNVTFLFIISSFFLQSLFAIEEICPNTNEIAQVLLQYDMISKAKIKDSYRTKEKAASKLQYHQADIFYSLTKKISDTSGWTYGIGIKERKIGLKYISPHRFRNMVVELGGFSKANDEWTLAASLRLNMNTRTFNLRKNTQYRARLDGIYKLNDTTHLQVGVFALKGINYTRILPILGFSYKPNEQITFKGAFPIGAFVHYAVDKTLGIYAGIKSFYARERLPNTIKVLGHKTDSKKQIFDIRGYGVEVGGTVTMNKNSNIGLHIGYSNHMRFRTSNKSGKVLRNRKLQSRPHAGITVGYFF